MATQVAATAVEEKSDNTAIFATIIAILIGIIVYMQISNRNKGVDVEQLTLADVVSTDSKPEETLDGVDKLMQALDQAEKTFERELTGNLTKNGFVQLRNLVSTLTQEEFKPKKEELMELRLQAYRESDW